MPIAAVYCRVSTAGQGEDGSSLESQRQSCLNKALELGYRVPADHIFSEIWTGVDLDRPLLTEIREMVRQRSIDAVICHSTDRLARKAIHVAILADEFAKRDIALVFVTEPLDSSPEGQLIAYVKGYAAEIEREKIRERSLRGKRSLASQGVLAMGAGKLFGYTYVPRIKKTRDTPGQPAQRLINGKESEIIRRVFRMVAEQGYTLYRVAKEMNEEAVPCPRGGRWSENLAWRILNNPAYKGETFAFRYKLVEPKTRKSNNPSSRKHKTHVFRNRSEWIPMPGVTPAIIEPSLWDAAHKQLEVNRLKSPRKRKYSYLLTGGHLRCGICGRAMSSSLRKGKAQDIRRYRCVSSTKSNYYTSCGQKIVRADWLEEVVWNEVSALLQKPEIALAQLDKERTKGTLSVDADIALCQKRLDDLEEELTRYLHQYGKGLIPERTFESEASRLNKLITKTKENAAQLETERQTIQDADLKYTRLIEAVKALAGRIQGADFDTKKLALQWLSIVATVNPDGSVTIGGALPPNAIKGATNYTNSSHCQPIAPPIPFRLPLVRLDK